MRYFEAVRNAAFGLLVVSATAWSQAKPVMRPIATIPGSPVFDFAVMPNGRVMYYVTDDSLLTFDLATKRASLVARGEFDDFSVSPRGDRVVFDRDNEDGSAAHIWTIAVDSATGMARGPAQRVSTREGHEPRISPDGRLVAFVSPSSPSPDLVVVPVTGGPERVVAHFDLSLSYVDWTPDGKWLLVHLPATARAGSVVQRVPVTGGTPETLFSVPALEGTQAAFDGEFTLFTADKAPTTTKRASYRGPRGEQGEFDMPPMSWGRIDPVLGRNRRYVLESSLPYQVHTVSIADGATKAIGPEREQSRTPSFSPDGKKLALQTSAAGSPEFTIVDTDGSGRRRFQLPVQTDPFTLIRWSPDSRRLATWGDGRRALVMLDVVTGSTRILHRAPRAVGAFRWTDNGDAVRFWEIASNGTRPIYDVPINGTPKRLRELPSDMTRRGMFVSQGLVEYGTESGEFVLPVDGGAPRRLPVEARPLNGVPSDHGLWWVFLLSADAGRRGRIQVVNAQGDTSRVIELPFEALRSQIPLSAFMPGNRSLVMVGRTLGQTAYKLFSVPIDGTAPREIATLSSDHPVTNLVLAPDGRTAAYTVELPRSATIHELDLRPLAQTAARPK